MACGPLNVDTDPRSCKEQGVQNENTTTHEIPSSCFRKRISSKSVLFSSGNVFLVKAAFRNGPESSAVVIQRDRRGSVQFTPPPKQEPTRLLPQQDLQNGIVGSVVSSSKLKIKALVSVKFFPLPCHDPSPSPPLIYILVLGLTQFL